MKNIFKQIISFILPVTVLILVPLYIETNISIKNIPAFLTGLLLICIGLTGLVLTIATLIRIGDGTLAPWSPTNKLVVKGMYGYVRNPMILSVLITLIGESIAITSLNILLWAAVFFIINNLFFALYEEPNLKRRFGDEYQEYKNNVPRWIPGLKPFKPDLK